MITSVFVLPVILVWIPMWPKLTALFFFRHTRLLIELESSADSIRISLKSGQVLLGCFWSCWWRLFIIWWWGWWHKAHIGTSYFCWRCWMDDWWRLHTLVIGRHIFIYHTSFLLIVYPHLLRILRGTEIRNNTLLLGEINFTEGTWSWHKLSSRKHPGTNLLPQKSSLFVPI